jgi:hypothetical protein
MQRPRRLQRTGYGTARRASMRLRFAWSSRARRASLAFGQPRRSRSRVSLSINSSCSCASAGVADLRLTDVGATLCCDAKSPFRCGFPFSARNSGKGSWRGTHNARSRRGAARRLSFSCRRCATSTVGKGGAPDFGDPTLSALTLGVCSARPYHALAQAWSARRRPPAGSRETLQAPRALNSEGVRPDGWSPVGSLEGTF